MNTSKTNLAVVITDSGINQYGILVQATCGKTSALIQIKEDSFRVIVQNAAHKVFKGVGKSFPNKAAALANYKSAEVRAMIEAADNLNH